MSFGDPHNPYGAPQGQPQYGYPQQAPQGIPPQAGYGYPQQAGYGYPAAPGMAGYPGAGMSVPMPGGVSAARVILWIMGSLQALGGVLVLVIGGISAAVISDSGSAEAEGWGALVGGLAVIVGLAALALSLWPILTAAKLSKGRTGIRVSGIIYGSLMSLWTALGAIGNLFALSDGTVGAGGILISLILSGIFLVLSIWVIAGLSTSAAGNYFRRP
ncbi:hypothetical protein [Streptomyces sp. NPDC048603]|uniref:hypothetical protein n=1 Tax=Streptomyces sp. NPDC048603 TaxID=3365577 RepID=UPI003717BFEA